MKKIREPTIQKNKKKRKKTTKKEKKTTIAHEIQSPNAQLNCATCRLEGHYCLNNSSPQHAGGEKVADWYRQVLQGAVSDMKKLYWAILFFTAVLFCTYRQNRLKAKMSKINSKTTIFQLKNQPHFHMSQRLYDRQKKRRPKNSNKTALCELTCSMFFEIRTS